MPLRDRAQPKPRPTAEAFQALEREFSELKAQVPLLYQRMMLAQQEADKKTASRASDFDREFEPINMPFRAWDPGSIITAKSLADEGDLERAADLWESCLSDDRIAAAMEQRINGLEGLPVRFTGDGEDVLWAISTDFWQMMTPGDRAAMRRWGLGVGICPVYVREWVESADGRQVPVCEVWNPRFLRWRQGETFGKREWWIQTSKSQIRLADQPGRWFLFTPFSGANQRPWVDGLWYSTATWWLAKSFGIADLASFSQSHATPKWFLMPREGAQIAPAEKAEAIRRLAALPQRSGMYVPAGFQIEQRESTSSSWQSISTEIDLANKALTVRILGTDSTTDKESSYASTSGGMQLLYGKFRTDADAESSFWHDGPLQFWYIINFAGTRKLQERRVLDLQCDERTGVYLLSDERARRNPDQRLRQLSEQIRAGDSVPWPTRDATPPQDMAAVADTQGKAAAALVQLTAAAAADPGIGAAIARIDVPRYLERYFPMLQQDESGAQLEMEDGTIIELGKGMTGSGWITVNGTHVHATPGQPINFKTLKSTNGGQSASIDVSASITDVEKLPTNTDPPWASEKITPKADAEWRDNARARLSKLSEDQRLDLAAFTGGNYRAIRMVQNRTKSEIQAEMVADAKKLKTGQFDQKYRTSAYQGIQKELISGKRAQFDEWHDSYTEQSKSIESAFSIADKSPGVVYRGMNLDAKSLATVMSKDTFETDAMSSASRSADMAANKFAVRRDIGTAVVMKLTHKSGLAIETQSQFPEEREVLLPKGAKFKVTKKSMVKSEDGDTVLIEMEEL